MLKMDQSSCNTMADTKINEQLNLNSPDFYFVAKAECDAEETSTEVIEQMSNMVSNEFENPDIHEDAVYYDESIKTNEDLIDDFDPDLNSVLKRKIKVEWNPNLEAIEYKKRVTNIKTKFREEEEEEGEEEEEEEEEGKEEEDEEEEGEVVAAVPEETEEEDEETIATFVTSTGQQLALYAVEDSDEVFAVAEYDESGEPPTNFQFLMKSDVEKLIGEGAVQTVRKPTQMKKQTYRGNDFDKEEFFQNNNENNDVSMMKSELFNADDYTRSPTYDEEEERVEINDVDNDISYQEMVDASYIVEENSDEYFQSIEETEHPEEIVQESTVQNIFHDDDQSDSELTFDEIEKSLAYFGKNTINSRSLLKKSFEPVIRSPERQSMNGTMISPETYEIRTSFLQKYVEKPTRRALNNSGMLKSKHVPRALLGRKGKTPDTRPTVFIHGSTALICCPIEEVQPELKIPKSSSSELKIKRPRKQQLTMVDRSDSEIIIQPASLEEEQEEPVPKKRGRRKKKRPELPLKNYSKQVSRVKRSRIEVIDIDADEEREQNIEEITIDDNKEKESSDKENEVIMVDSDEEDSQEEKKNSVILKCEHCSRSFRQKRALDTHTRVCPKSPSTRRRVEKDNQSSPKDSSTSKKQYVCKVCSDTFDVVVALARHARSHRKKKVIIEDEEYEEVKKDVRKIKEKVVKQKPPISITRRKNKNKNIRQLLKVKKMYCIDCGRWFASSAMLSAHCLQHSTRKSEKQIIRCQLCRKLFRSRLFFIRHMKIHDRANKLQKQLRSTRQSTSKITNIRKRGRPKKL